MNDLFQRVPLLRDALHETVTHLRLAQDGCLLIAITEDDRLRREATAALVEQLYDRLAFEEYTCDPNYPSLAAHLEALPPPQGPTLVLAGGLESLPPDVFSRAIRLLNLEREALKSSRRSILLWVRPATIQPLIHQAGDFWAWRSAVLEFRLPPGVELRPSHPARLPVQELARLYRFKDAYERQLASASPAASSTADMKLQLADVYRQLGFPERQVMALRREGLALKAQTGDEEAQIQAYNQFVVDRYGRLTLYSLKADAPLSVELEKVYVRLTAVERGRPAHVALDDLLTDPTSDSFIRRAIASGGGGPPMSTDLTSDLASGDAFGLRGMSISEGYECLDQVLSVREEAEERGEEREERRPEREATVERVLSVREEAEETGEEREERRPEREATVERVLSVEQALAESPRLVVVGAPGSGKTTLLAWIALTFARDLARDRLELEEHRVPVFVPLRTLGKYIEAHPDRFEPTPACLLDFLETHFAGWQLNLPAGFFARLAEEERCTLLFDGLDEVADPGRRALVAEAVRAFVARYGGNRYVVTSRPAGYTGLARFGADFRRCDIRPFSDQDVEDFVTNWYLAVETAVEDNSATRQKARDNGADLLQRIQENDRIRRLVDTPLLLSVVALVHQIRTTLPQRRAELYDECTQQLLGFWDEQRGGEAAQELARLGGLDRQEKRAILEPLALKFHERREGREVDGPQLRHWIQEEFEALGETQAARRAETFLRVIKERAGLLVESEPDTYRFSHLTFQEYLAARAVADQDDYIDYTLARRHDPWWREVILLEAGHLSTPRSKRARRLTSDLVRALWKEEEEGPLEREVEGILRRDLLLAGCCLADLGSIGVEEAVRDGIVAELGEILRTTPYSRLREEVARVLAGLGGSGSAARATAELTHALANADSWRVRQAAASSLVQLGQASPEVVQTLIHALADARWDVRQAAASSLVQLGQASPEMVGVLVEALKDPDNDVRKAVANGLARLADSDREAVLRVILPVFTDPAFAEPDQHEHRPGHDYAFDALWAIAGHQAPGAGD